MTDAELIARLLEEETDLTDCAADRIEVLTAKVKLMDDLDAINGEKIEALTKERDDYAHKLMQANNTYTGMHLEIERLSDKLAKARRVHEWRSHDALRARRIEP